MEKETSSGTIVAEAETLEITNESLSCIQLEEQLMKGLKC